MKIYCMFGQRKLGGFIELMVSWDEDSAEGNPEGFDATCEAAKLLWGDDLETFRMINIEAGDIAKYFETPEVKAKTSPGIDWVQETETGRT